VRIEDLELCIKNSWCVEKHWDAILRVLRAAKKVAGDQDLADALLALEEIN